MQDQRPIAFHSQLLKGKALQLSTYEKELLALVTAVHKWRPYLLGRPFVIKIDQQSLKSIASADTPSSLCLISFPYPSWINEPKTSYQSDPIVLSLLQQL